VTQNASLSAAPERPARLFRTPGSRVTSLPGENRGHATRLRMGLLSLGLLTFLAFDAGSLSASQPYDIGAPIVRDVWVDPVNGRDTNGGTSRSDALATLTEAWNRIPRGTPLTATGYRIQLMAGRYDRSTIPTYLESRYGTARFPIVVQSADGSRSAHLAGDLNVFDTRYLYLIGLDMVPEPAGDVFHCEKCDHVLIRDSNLDGGNRAAYDMCKVNQSQYIFIEGSTLRGATDTAVDFVAVQHGHVIDSKISNAEDWCMYAKGGSAYLRYEGNELFGCGTGGFSAGQGSGFQFMVSPWIHYEAYDIKFVNNVIHDMQGAGFEANGGYDVLFAYNTLYRVGVRSHMMGVTFGNRSCDGNPGDPGRDRCQASLNLGGWGTTIVDDGTNYVRIPSRNVYIYNNVLYNPPGFASPQHLYVAGPYREATQNGSNVPFPATVDVNLEIRGNVIFNGTATQPLGLDADSGCGPSNPTCNEPQILSENTINLFQPQFVSAASADFRVATSDGLATARTFAIPDFSWSDAPPTPAAPPGDPSNAVPSDRGGAPRAPLSTAGAYVAGSAPVPSGKRRAARH
jgi:hypothetical protein